MQKIFLTLLLCCVAFLGKAQLTAPSQNHILKFNNSGAFAPVDDRLKLGAEFTMAAWVNPTNRTPYNLVMGKPATDRDADPWMSYAVVWNNSGNRLEFVQTTGAAGTYRGVTSQNDIPLNTWTHVAATLSNGTMRLYVNGQLAGTTQSPGLPQSNNVPFGIGGGINKGNYCCGSSGYIKQVGVWNKALSAAEVQAVAGTAPAANQAGLVAFWMLDEGAGQVAQDKSGNNLHATLGTTAAVDQHDPTWQNNFYSEKEPFFVAKATTIAPALPHVLEDIYPFDINQDGKPEFLGVSIAWPPTPFPGTFRPIQVLGTHQNLTVTNQTAQFFPAPVEMVHPRHIATADFNKDGFMDVITIGHGTDTHPFPGEQSLLLFGQADGTLRNVTSTHMPQSIDFTHHVSIGDIDNDGDVDVYMANIGGGTHGPLIYLNNGNGVFSVGTNNLPVAVADRHLGAFTASVFADFDRDGDLDLMLGGDENTAGNLVLLNNGSGVFTIKENAIDKKVPGINWITVAFALADFDQDGDLDVITSNTPGHPFYKGAFLQLLLNDGHANFTDASSRITQEFSSEGWVKWVDPVDLNKDGILDLVLSSNGGLNNTIFMGVGNARFKQVSVQLPPSDGPMRAADVDSDGDMDLISVRGNTAYVGENVQLLALSTAPLNLIGEQALCQGASAGPLLSTPQKPNNTYAWLKDAQAIDNAASNSYQVTSPGRYRVVVKHGDYPTDTSLVANVVVTPLPQASITQNGNQLTASEGASYRWFKDNTLLPNETTRTITPTASGEYKVEVTNTAGCQATSASYAFTLTAAQEEVIVKYTRVFPNPTSGKLNVQIEGPYTGRLTATLFTSTGKVVQKRSFRKAGNLAFTFDLSKQANQLFLLLIETDSGTSTYKVLKSID